MYLYSYALKQFRETIDSVEEKVLNNRISEANNLCRLQHTSIVQFKDSFIIKNKFYIVMELCEVNFICVIF